MVFCAFVQFAKNGGARMQPILLLLQVVIKANCCALRLCALDTEESLTL
jgi:acetyl-CoA carboxylase beta subunit